MNQSSVIRAIDDYLNSSQKGFGILLDGSWGTGKTWIIKENILKGRDYIYVSLFGISTIKEIEDKIISEMLNISEVDDESIKKSTGILGSIGEILDIGDKGDASILGVIASTVGSSIKKNIVGNVSSNKVLIFDDLERAKIGQSEILSYVNTFIEKNNKVIFIANESEITDSKYKLTKEKVIGYSYKLENSLIYIYNISIAEYKDRKKLFNSLKKMSPYVESNKNIEYECKNIRTLKYSIYYYSLIFNLLKDNPLFEKHSYELLYSCIVYSIFVREYHIHYIHMTKEYFNINEKSTIINNTRYEKSSEEEGNRINEKFNLFYGTNNLNPDYAEVYYLIQYGQLDENSLLFNVNKWKLKVKEPTIFEKFFNLNDRTEDKVFTSVISEVIDGLKSRDLKFSNVKMLWDVYSKLMLYRDMGGINIEHSQLLNLINEHLLYIRTNLNDLNIASVLTHYLMQTYISDENKDIEVIYKEIVKLNNIVGKHIEENQFDAFYLSLEQDGQYFYEKFEGDYSVKPLLADIDLDELIKIVENWSPEQVVNFSRFISSRYLSVNIFDFLKGEKPFIKNLHSRLKTYSKNLKKSNKNIQITYLISYLSHILNK